MRLDGVWFLCDDGVTRPVFWAEVNGSHDRWFQVPFLADTGADRTVFTRDVFAALGFLSAAEGELMAGIGGLTESLVFESRIRIPRRNGEAVSFRGQFAAILTSTALDMSVLGRDITNLFALIVDRPASTVCLRSRGEAYVA